MATTPSLSPETSAGCEPDWLGRSPDGLFRISRWLPWIAKDWFLTMCSMLLRGCVEELCSLPYRIRLQYRLATLRGAWCVGPVCEPRRTCTEALQPNMKTLACMQGIQSFVADHPWATDYDRILFRDAWEAGAKWGLHTSDCGKEGDTSHP